MLVFEEAKGSWTLVVTRAGSAASTPRTVHESSCEALAEVAPLVVSAWMQEDPATAAAPEPSTDRPPGPASPARFGFAAFAEGGLWLLPQPDFGGSLEFFVRSPGLDRPRFAFGTTYWAGRDETPVSMRTERYSRPIFEMYAEAASTGALVIGPVELNLYVAVELGYGQPDKDSQHVGLRATLGPQASVRLGQDWALLYKLGLYFRGPSDRSYVGLTTSLGVEYAAW